MSYQTRSTRTDALLLASLQGQGLGVQEVDACEHHPDFTVGVLGARVASSNGDPACIDG